MLIKLLIFFSLTLNLLNCTRKFNF